MTLQEVCEQLEISESSLKSNFKRTAESLLKKGIVLIKEGRGDKAEYFIEYQTDNRGENLYKECKNEIILSRGTVNSPAWEFLVFLTIATTPMIVFRGSYKEFLEYIQNPVTPDSLKNLKDALASLSKRELIMYNIDKTDNNYFVAAIYRQVEVDTKIGIEMVRECKKLQEQNGKRSWIPILKTWIGVQMAHENQPYTYKELEQITGLSKKVLMENTKMLEKSNVFKTTKVYAGYDACLGKNVDLNVFYEGNRK